MLSKAVQSALSKCIQQSFQTEVDQLEYWLESCTQLVYSEPPLDATIEFTDSLPECYQLSLVVTSDAGEGIYYLYKENPHGM